MNQSSIKQIASQRIQILFAEAQTVGKTNAMLAKHYVRTAKRIAMAARIRLPSKFRQETCKNCDTLLYAGANCRVRVKQKREPHVVITCLNCGNQTRLLIHKNKGKKRLE